MIKLFDKLTSYIFDVKINPKKFADFILYPIEEIVEEDKGTIVRISSSKTIVFISLVFFFVSLVALRSWNFNVAYFFMAVATLLNLVAALIKGTKHDKSIDLDLDDID